MRYRFLASLIECLILFAPLCMHGCRMVKFIPKTFVYRYFYPEPESKENLIKRVKIEQMMDHAWDNYVRYAWGENELRPISKEGCQDSVFGPNALGATIVDSMDTLYIMGKMVEFDRARNWVMFELKMDNVDRYVSAFETNIRYVGGLLSCYALTGDPMFRDKAQYVADKLLPVFDTPTGIPFADVNFATGNATNCKRTHFAAGYSVLAEIGAFHLEFTYLSDITGNSTYRDKVVRIRKFLDTIHKPNGLYSNYLHPSTGKFGRDDISMGAFGDAFYEYLLKSWIQSGKKNKKARKMYQGASKAVNKHLLQKSKKGLTYFSEVMQSYRERCMNHEACFTGGLYALGAHTLGDNEYTEYMNIAMGITDTCHESCIRTATGLCPEVFQFTDFVEAKALKSEDKYYALRPELIESYFVLWRLTKDQKYRDWGWEVAQAIEKHCRVEGGYTGLKNVYVQGWHQDDIQPSFFLAETLKYLYLLFSEDDVIDLNQWVFNTEGHPLPIKGAHPFYQKKNDL